MAGQVPVSPALLIPTNNVEEIRRFASAIGYPIMVKAVDGGGGRGIRLIRSEEQLVSSVKRAVEESPSKQVFAEKAAVDGFRHIEVQILGDGTGNVTHLWERECSIQRRYQKVVELAPSVVSDRKLIARVIEDALRIAREVSSDANTVYLREAKLLIQHLGQILLPRHLRIPAQPQHATTLLPRNQSPAPSRAHNHRMHIPHRHRQVATPARSGRIPNDMRLTQRHHSSRPSHPAPSTRHPAPNHRRKRTVRLVPLHRQNHRLEVSERKWREGRYASRGWAYDDRVR
jgi:hypothetical protein